MKKKFTISHATFLQNTKDQLEKKQSKEDQKIKISMLASFPSLNTLSLLKNTLISISLSRFMELNLFTMELVQQF